MNIFAKWHYNVKASLQKQAGLMVHWGSLVVAWPATKSSASCINQRISWQQGISGDKGNWKLGSKLRMCLAYHSDTVTDKY